MNDLADLLAELFSLLGLVGAGCFAAAWLILKAVRGRWVEVPAEVVDGELRWMDLRGTFHSGRLDEDAPADVDDFHIFYRQRTPERYHLRRIAHDERTLGVVAACLGGVGAVAAVASVMLLFV